MELDDLRLVRALQLAPRASFARLAEVVGVHERTAARRYRRLRRAGIVRIFGMVNPMAVGYQFWQVRVRCRPDASESLATALAARDDIAWVAVTAAGSEVSFSVRSLSAERRDLLLTRLLPRSAQVLDIEAAVVLHIFRGLSSRGWSSFGGALTAEEITLLTAEEVAEGEAAPIPLEPCDSAFFGVLAADGRATTAQLAEAAGISEGRAARRLAVLRQSRTLIIDLDLAHEVFGITVGAQIYFAVTPARLHEVGEALARLPEVGFAAALSGRHNLMASVACRDLSHLYAFMTADAGTLDAIVSMEVVPLARMVKQSGGLIADGRLVDPGTARD
ncbi:Lrp/AsnC family transcriptional regulator [Nocardia sp. NBC_01327]|uniref:Lrp/AsnC family transcriptional regulator n=1 Tax=Nocardia sp. NBC_01327 TaxID=2903593 RepID=UPI002E120708|nr:Lrp/AsnC family transcriptional regulator [Nocardia sp. NBC_01327]